MRTIGLFEAKQKLSELVGRAQEGEKIGITRHGRLAAILVPAVPESSLKEVFADMERLRQKVKRPRGVSIKDLIEEGRT
jgi:prevent-host-death family protein